MKEYPKVKWVSVEELNSRIPRRVGGERRLVIRELNVSMKVR